MVQNASATSRGPRAGSRTTRSSHRGGIQKRIPASRSQRFDKDGDLDMSAGNIPGNHSKSGKGHLATSAPSGPGGLIRGRGTASRGKAAIQHAIERGLRGQEAQLQQTQVSYGGTMVTVDGLMSSKAASNPDGGLQNLSSFLERKASALDAKSNRPIRIKKSYIRGDSVFIVASPDDIEQILKLNNFVFAGATLSIKSHDPMMAPVRKAGKEKTADQGLTNAVELKERLKAVLATRYDVALKLLNLSNLDRDTSLQELGLGALDGRTQSKLFPALMVVCEGLFDSWKAKRDAVISVTLSGNALSTVASVTTLAQTFPDIKNLDLSVNQLADMKALEPWRWKFRNLENLILTGNPLETQIADYKAEIVKWYPRLLTLDGVQVRTPEDVVVTIAAANSPIPISGPDFRDVDQVGENFVRQFLYLYDRDRPTLLTKFYDEHSSFSLSVNTTAPRNREYVTAVPGWSAYLSNSRNLVKISHLNARMTRLCRGLYQIQTLWTTLPGTRHPDISTLADKYLIDCHPQPGLADPTAQTPQGVDGLYLTIHGEFEEVATVDKGLRSFSRTFILGPGASGATPIRVVSDMLVLRAHSPLATAFLPPQPTSEQGPEQSVVEPSSHEVLTTQLVDKTSMTPTYAALCLTETGWDLAKALTAFNENKDKLPPDAFLPTTMT